MRAAELERYLDPTLSQAGFRLSAIEDPTIYQDRPAWVIYLLGDGCKLQICWSEREGGIDYLLAPLDAPDEFGLLNQSKKWRLMLLLSTAHDDLVTPAPGANDQVEMAWLKALFEIHVDSARASLLASSEVVVRVTSGESFNLSDELQLAINRLSEQLNVPSMQVGLRTNDGLNVYVADGEYHFAFYERGTIAFDQAGSLDDLLYWYCESVVTRQAAKLVGDRKERLMYEYQVLSQFDAAWAKRRVRELAATFANGQPEDISLLPDIGDER